MLYLSSLNLYVVHLNYFGIRHANELGSFVKDIGEFECLRWYAQEGALLGGCEWLC
jgi:hypothetical protein